MPVSNTTRIACLVATSMAAVRSLHSGAASAQAYTFSKIADSAIHNIDPFGTGSPAISDSGFVAFNALTRDQTDSRVLRRQLGGPLTVIADENNAPELSFSRTVSVNNMGQVSVWASDSSPDLFERIIVGSGGPLTTIALAGDAEMFNFMSVVTSINDAGTVAWQGEPNAPGFPQGLFTGNGGPVNTIFRTDTSDFTSSFAGPDINNAGQIAFRASTTTSGGDAIFRYDGGGVFTTIVDDSGPYSSLFDDEPSINNAGAVVTIGANEDFSTRFVLVGDGSSPVTPIADTTGDFESFNAASINDLGQVAFSAGLDDFISNGIFTGPDLVANKVIQTGDTLDGSIVSFVSMYRGGLNNSGQITFFTLLEDGRGVVMVATPIPATGTLASLLAAGLVMPRRRR